MSTVLECDVNCNSSVLVIHGKSSQSSETFDERKKKEYDKKTMCTKCELTFSARRGLLSHYKKFHPEEVNNFLRKTNVICPVCNCDNKTIFDLQNHIQEKHKDIELKFENLEFFTWEDFNTWKNNTEKQSISLFLKRRAGTILADGRSVVHYYCHRSGCYRPQGTGKRRLKSIGSNKINKSCPAHMTVHSETNQGITLITVQYQSVHVGHRLDIERFPLSKSDQDGNTRFEQSDANTYKSKSGRKRRKPCFSSEKIENIQRDFHNACEGNNPNANHNENVALCVETNECYEYVNEEQREAYYIQRPREDEIQSMFTIDDQKAVILSKFLTLLNKSRTDEEMKVMHKCIQSMESMLSAVNGVESFSYPT